MEGTEASWSSFRGWWFCALLVHVFGVAPCLGAKPNCGFYYFTIGDFEAAIISDGVFIFPTVDLFSTVPQAAVKDAVDRNFESMDSAVLYNNALFVDTGSNKVLIDTGSSNQFLPTAGRLLDNMAAAEIDPNEIDIVLISHAHVDHIGGTAKPDGSLAFPNAMHFISRLEFDYWTGVNVDDIKHVVDYETKNFTLGRAKKGLEKIGDSLTLFEFDEEVVPGITAKGLVGHTPGMAGFEVKSGNASLLYTADVVFFDYMSISNPEWIHDNDLDGQQAIKTRISLLEELARSGKLSSNYHLDFPGIGHIRKDGSKYGYRAVRHRLEF